MTAGPWPQSSSRGAGFTNDGLPLRDLDRCAAALALSCTCWPEGEVGFGRFLGASQCGRQLCHGNGQRACRCDRAVPDLTSKSRQPGLLDRPELVEGAVVPPGNTLGRWQRAFPSTSGMALGRNVQSHAVAHQVATTAESPGRVRVILTPASIAAIRCSGRLHGRRMLRSTRLWRSLAIFERRKSSAGLGAGTTRTCG